VNTAVSGKGDSLISRRSTHEQSQHAQVTEEEKRDGDGGED